MKIKSALSEFKSTFYNVLFLMHHFKEAKKGRLYVILRVLLTIVDSIFPVIYMIFPGMIINELSGEGRVQILIMYVAIVSIMPLINHIKDLTIGVYINNLNRELVRTFEINLHSYIADMEYASFESPQISVQLSRILNGAPGAPIDMFNYLIRLLRALINIAAILTIMAYLNSVVILILLIIVIINSVVNKKISKVIYDNDLELDNKNKVLWSEFDNLSNPENGKEIRLFETKDYFINRYADIAHEIDKQINKNDTYVKKLKSVTVLTGFAQQVLLYIFPIWQVLFNGLAIGSMTVFMSAGNQFAGSLNDISGAYLDIVSYCLHVKEIKDFQGMPTMRDNSGTKIPSFSKNSVIEFRNVSFKYPGSETYALKNMNIKIPCNQKLCIVGKNGSGKSTFIKLLTMLYLPTDGEILLDGVNIKKFNRFAYMRLFSPVFQDFSKYRLTLTENIALEKKYDIDRVVDAINRSGLSSLVEKLSKGYDTYVGKQIDSNGFEPSGGEGQKLAIARAIYHDRPIYLLDEPTAALDPAAEYEIYSSFTKMITGRTAILITHRMSAVQLANCIAVFDNGNVVEYGTHAELYAKGGIYTEMFNKQAQFYRDEQPETLKSAE